MADNSPIKVEDDFLRSPRIRALCAVFSRLAHLVIDINRPDGTTLAHFNESAVENPFCREVKANLAGYERCAACAGRANRAAFSESSLRRYRCDFGFNEIVVPVCIGGRARYAIATGQFVTEKKLPSDFEAIRPLLASLGLDSSILREAYLATRVIDEELLRGVTEFLGILFQQLLEAFHENEALRQGQWGHRAVVEARAFVKEHFAEKLGLGEIASRVGLSPSHFERLFKKETGQSFLVFVTSVRMRHARELLFRMPVVHACQAVGYQSLSFFTKTFKGHFGVTPGHFQRSRKAQDGAKLLSSG